MSDETNMDYDERTCITAGELRELGCTVPKSIPDCAWVPRGTMRLVPGARVAPDNRGTMTIMMEVRFTEPFRWLDVRGTLTDLSQLS